MSVVPLDQAFDPSVYGGKAAQLGAAARSGLPVPEGYAVSCDMVERLVGGGDCAKEWFRLPDESNARFAVRSSAADEDGAAFSGAGIYATVLNISGGHEMLEAIRLVARSGLAAPAAAYRQRQGIRSDGAVAVVVQRMVNADRSGVMFTRHPLTGADERVIEACRGLGESVASGRIVPDLYTFGRGAARMETRIGCQETAIYPADGCGTKEVGLDERFAGKACLAEEDIRRLDDLAAQCERIFGSDLDLEWAFSEDRLYLLQCRKITVFGQKGC